MSKQTVLLMIGTVAYTLIARSHLESWVKRIANKTYFENQRMQREFSVIFNAEQKPKSEPESESTEK